MHYSKTTIHQISNEADLSNNRHHISLLRKKISRNTYIIKGNISFKFKFK